MSLSRVGAALLLFAAASAWADDYPDELIREQLEQATRRIEIDVSRLERGTVLSREYLGRPILVYRRTAA
ncbi:MAG: ubiquinol-cytochrome c reductase iron-sulfur subunit, partial [Betaproteobacteria bacterium]|nr:ubiquinol-cytochrome c reductase iron-sulfur subunit [Betaproteobacteria bacterium]